MNQTILDYLTGDQIAAVLQPYLRHEVPMTAERQAQFHAAVDGLFSSYPGLAARLVVDTPLVQENAELAGSLLAQAYVRAVDDKTRENLRNVATKAGLIECLPDPDASGCILTDSQVRAMEVLRAMAEAYFEGATRPGLNLRYNPLLVGPSGVGKSFLSNLLGDKLNMPVLKLTVGDWVPVGAKASPTYGQIQEYLNAYPAIILHLDELDKFKSDSTNWGQSLTTEIYSLLDRKISFAGSNGAPWTEEHNKALRERVFTIGAATFQDVWKNQTAKPVGFGHKGTAPVISDIAKHARAARIIADELVNRFNDNWLMLDFYTEEDFRKIGRQYGLVEPQINYAELAASKLNFRGLESAATQLEIARRLGRSA